jgi:hypothetical protein
MDINKITEEFANKQKLNGASDKEIEEVLLLASTVAIQKTSKDLESYNPSDSVLDVVKKLQENPQEVANTITANEFLREKVNESGDTISDLVIRNYKSYLDQL